MLASRIGTPRAVNEEVTLFLAALATRLRARNIDTTEGEDIIRKYNHKYQACVGDIPRLDDRITRLQVKFT